MSDDADLDELRRLQAWWREAQTSPIEQLQKENAALRAELELERRKDHAYRAFTNGYERAIEDVIAGRTAQWPPKARARLR